MSVIDHLVVSATTLAAGTDWTERALGMPLAPGGEHPDFGTHNRLLSLGGKTYLEAIAIDPNAVPPGRARWFDLDAFSGAPRLTSWVVAVEDLSGVVAGLDGAWDVLPLSRGPYRWKMAVPEGGALPLDGLHPALIEWQGPHPAPALPGSGSTLSRLVLRTPHRAALAGVPGVEDPRVSIEEGPHGISAQIITPAGPVWL